VHEDDAHFVILPGHEAPGVERVIEEHEDWCVVEKLDIGDVRKIVERDG
jgi:hypothetical protein